MAEKRTPPVLVITGPTASGKSDVALELCVRLNGELINGDAFQIYRGMDIGTAKTPEPERRGVPHHLVDIKNLSESYSVADYVKDATACIQDIQQRHRLPVLCGGTGLYIQSLLEGLDFSPQPQNEDLREQIRNDAERLGFSVMLERLMEKDPESALTLHPNNHRRILRMLEAFELTGLTARERNVRSKQKGSPFVFESFCLTLERPLLYQRIDERVDHMIDSGLLKEVETILSSFPDITPMQAIGYKEFIPYLNGSADLDSCMNSVKMATRRYAKRQLTWFRRMSTLQWLDNRIPDDSIQIIEEKMRK